MVFFRYFRAETTTPALKKLIAISFLLVIFINQLGYYFVHSLQQYEVRKEIKRAMLANIPESQLEIIAAQGEMEWEEEGKEFYFEGHMYDVVKTKLLDGKTVYYCINDTKEKQLLDHLVNIVKSSRGNGKRQLIKFHVIDSELPQMETIISPVCLKERYITLTPRLIFSATEIPLPPPRC
jgi:hypothetical protein